MAFLAEPVRSHAYWDAGGQRSLARFGTPHANATPDAAANEPVEGRTAHAFHQELDGGGSRAVYELDTPSTTRPGLASLRTKVRAQLRGRSDFRAQGRAANTSDFGGEKGFKAKLPLFSLGPDPYRVQEDNLWSTAPPGNYVEIGERKRTDVYKCVLLESRGAQLDTVDNKPWQTLETKSVCVSPARSNPLLPSPGTVRYRGKHRIPESNRVFNKEFNAFNWGVQSRVHRPSPTLRTFFKHAISPF